MKQIKNYLHLYLGCEAIIHFMNEDIVCEIITVSNGGAFLSGKSKDGKAVNRHGAVDGVKPILRPLSDMAKDEMDRCMEIKSVSTGGIVIRDVIISVSDPEITRYLLSKGFDLFNLIPEGLALDKNTLDLKGHTPLNQKEIA
jgi:hypothetical protein